MVRDMQRRGRPAWLQVVVIVLNLVCYLGLLVWALDRRKHPLVPTPH
jgi:hypothetical protein